MIKKLLIILIVVIGIIPLISQASWLTNLFSDSSTRINLGASIFAPIQGGTGTSTVPTPDQILIGGNNSRYDVKTLLAGSNISIATSSGSVTISSTGSSGTSVNQWATSSVDTSDIHPNGALQVLIGDTALTANASSTLHIVGSISTTASTTSGSPTLTSLDYQVNVNATGGTKTITLPTLASSLGREYIISKTDSSTNLVTVDGNGSETINGALTKDISAQYSSMHIINVSSEWRII